MDLCTSLIALDRVLPRILQTVVTAQIVTVAISAFRQTVIVVYISVVHLLCIRLIILLYDGNVAVCIVLYC